MKMNMEMKYKNFAVFILTHGRPENIITYESLKKSGYTGKLYFIIDNEDKLQNEYINKYGVENVIIFDKQKYADESDECNNFDDHRCILMARNACFDIAKKIGIKYFIQLDDDYTSFRFTADNNYNYRTDSKTIKNINKTFDSFIDFYEKSNALSIAFSQGGDFIGGEGSSVWTKKLSRKCMNSFFCSVDRPFKFIGTMNDDVNTYTTLGSRGFLFFTLAWIRLEQKATQSQSGGISDMYKKYGTYIKSFTTVMNMPSSVKISKMGVSDLRIHHKINWNNTVPKIINENIKKI